MAIRCLPLLVDEIRTLLAVRPLRRRERPARRVSLRQAIGHAARERHGLLTTAIVVALRRALDLADAIEAHGGFASAPGSQVGPGRADLLVLVLVTAVGGVALVV